MIFITAAIVWFLFGYTLFLATCYKISGFLMVKDFVAGVLGGLAGPFCIIPSLSYWLKKK